ncbi:MAG: cell division protein ZapA [Treponema sp.]|nr:cell division protein ZapA [Treponema sp.]
MAVQTLRIELLGASFTIQTDESREYMDAILAHIRRRTEEVQRTTRVTDPLKTSILTSVYIVDELFRERAHRPSREADQEELGRAADRMIERLERALSDLDTDPDVGGSDAP